MNRFELLSLPSQEGAPVREVVTKIEQSVTEKDPQLIDAYKLQPQAVRFMVAGYREVHSLNDFPKDTEVARETYTEGLLLAEDKFVAGGHWRLRWELGVRDEPVLGIAKEKDKTLLPDMLSSKEATKVRDVLWARGRAVQVMAELIPPEERPSLVAGWSEREGLTSGMSASVIQLLAMYDLAKIGGLDEIGAIDSFFTDYFWRASLDVNKPKPEKPESFLAKDVKNFQVAGVMSALMNGKAMEEVELQEYLAKFKVKNAEDFAHYKELYGKCLDAKSFAPLFDENARIVGRLYLHGYFVARMKELQPQMGVEAYKRTLAEMVLLATLKVTPESFVFDRIQGKETQDIYSIMNRCFN